MVIPIRKNPTETHRFKDLESPQRYTPTCRLWHAIELIGSVDLCHGPSRYQESQAEIDLEKKNARKFLKPTQEPSQVLRSDETELCTGVCLLSRLNEACGNVDDPCLISGSSQGSFLSSIISHCRVSFLPHWYRRKCPQMLLGGE